MTSSRKGPDVEIDNQLADIQLIEAGGGDVRLGDVWTDQTTVIAWLRHYR